MARPKKQVTPSELNWGEVYFINRWDPQSDTVEVVLSGIENGEIVTKETVSVYPVDPDFVSVLVHFIGLKMIVRKLTGILRVLEDYFFPEEEEEKKAFHDNKEPLL